MCILTEIVWFAFLQVARQGRDRLSLLKTSDCSPEIVIAKIPCITSISEDQTDLATVIEVSFEVCQGKP